mmetsp:Transcript_26938/g.44174  ORF Transcript_26938/g.44174 Transcript_26938/m.44174 type:complete len:263 (+) Transcript_26938:708-1496(+)
MCALQQIKHGQSQWPYVALGVDINRTIVQIEHNLGRMITHGSDETTAHNIGRLIQLEHGSEINQAILIVVVAVYIHDKIVGFNITVHVMIHMQSKQERHDELRHHVVQFVLVEHFRVLLHVVKAVHIPQLRDEDKFVFGAIQIHFKVLQNRKFAHHTIIVHSALVILNHLGSKIVVLVFLVIIIIILTTAVLFALVACVCWLLRLDNVVQRRNTLERAISLSQFDLVHFALDSSTNLFHNFIFLMKEFRIKDTTKMQLYLVQ